MKKRFAVMMGMIAMAGMTGCNALYGMLGTDSATVHEKAVDASFRMAESSVRKKLSSLLDAGKITKAEHDALLTRWTEQAEPALRRLIDDIYAKYEAEKSATEEK